MFVANENLNIAEGEGGGVQFSVCVFTWAKEGKLSGDNHGGDPAKKVRRYWDHIGYVHDAQNDKYGYGFGTVGRRIFNLPCGNGALETMVRVECLIRTGTSGPHREERSFNCP